MGRILVLAGVNGAGKSSLLGSHLRAMNIAWFNPDSYARQLVENGWSSSEANAQAWMIGRDGLENAIETDSNLAFETSLGGNTITTLLLQACQKRQVTIWFCGLDSVDLHIQRVAARVAAGGHDIPHEKILARYDASRLNLIRLLPHLAELHVYDNSRPADADGLAELLPVLRMKHGRIHYPDNADAFSRTPGWAKPIVMEALKH